ncbi:MAG TPA: hypothetical protein VMF52_02270 [Steroidobacteraceae bacterium]|nr:hypothetical protein [Steroidobacteraceae bacterium]
MSAITSIPSALQSAVSAIQRSQANLNKDAAVVANAAADPEPLGRDVLSALIDSRQQQLYTAAAAKLISASDEITQSILDVTA